MRCFDRFSVSAQKLIVLIYHAAILLSVKVMIYLGKSQPVSTVSLNIVELNGYILLFAPSSKPELLVPKIDGYNIIFPGNTPFLRLEMQITAKTAKNIAFCYPIW